jgi:hypothetical protein
VVKWRGAATMKIETGSEYRQPFDICMNLHIGDTFSNTKRQHIFEQYLRLHEVIDE